MIMIEQLQSYIVEDGYENNIHNNVIVYDVIHLVHELNGQGLVLIPEVSSEYGSCNCYNLSVVRHVHSFIGNFYVRKLSTSTQYSLFRNS